MGKKNEVIEEKMLPAFMIEQKLEAHKHIEVQGMINIYICTACQKDFMYSYLDGGVTPMTFTCPECKTEGSCVSCGLKGRQPNSVWYRPKYLSDLEDLVEAAYLNDEEMYKGICKKNNTTPKELKKTILKNYIRHYNQGGLFAKKLVLPFISDDKDESEIITK